MVHSLKGETNLTLDDHKMIQLHSKDKEVFDNFMTIFFSNIYFPSVYVYVGTLLIVAIAFITSMFNKMLNKIYKIINGITFVMNNILLAIILNIIAKNKIDVFTPNSLYTNINLVAVLAISNPSDNI